MAQFDSAVKLIADTAEARLQAAEWRVLLPSLGIVGVSDAEAARGRQALEQIAGGQRQDRALWALGLDALARGDSAGAARWRAALVARQPAGGPLVALLDAAAAADPETSLDLSAPGLAFDSAGSAPDPFFRAALHLARGEWAEALGRHADADRSRLWYENTDAVGWPDAVAQPADVDWALGTFARARRALSAVAQGDLQTACPLARRVLQIWSNPEAPIAAMADRLRRAAPVCWT